MTHAEAYDQWSARRIAQLRRKRRATQEELARDLGVSLTTVARWERGTCRPAPLAIEALRRMEQRRGS